MRAAKKVHNLYGCHVVLTAEALHNKAVICIGERSMWKDLEPAPKDFDKNRYELASAISCALTYGISSLESIEYGIGFCDGLRKASELTGEEEAQEDPEPEPVQDEDPTVDLMKDFDLNLDDFRNPEPQTPSAYSGYTGTSYTSDVGKNSGTTGFETPDFGSFDTPAKPQEEALPDLEVEVYEEKTETQPVTEAEAKSYAEPEDDLFTSAAEEPDAGIEPEPEKAPEPPRRRGKHEAPDPSDPFTDSWYQSVGLNRRDKNK